MSRWRRNKRWLKRYFNKIVRKTAIGSGNAYRCIFGKMKDNVGDIYWWKRNKYQRGDVNGHTKD